jgi:amidohydrolase
MYSIDKDSLMESTLQGQLKTWRQHLHQRPETGFEEVSTSDYVANILKTLGLEVHRGLGGTGLVASLTVGNGKRAIGLRADMDALNIAENAPDRAHASVNAGKMHACGHDGHMSMILGAARLLAERRDFNGTVRFIFQPAEEHGRGAKAMMADGLFERFPVDAIFGAHNMPGMPAGSFATRAGGIMASEDNFAIHIKGRGAHAARPHMGVDPIVVAAQIVLALQTIVSRNLDTSLQAVISCTEIITDGIRNVIPSNVIIKGDTRSYSKAVQAMLETRMREVSEGICRARVRADGQFGAVRRCGRECRAKCRRSGRCRSERAAHDDLRGLRRISPGSARKFHLYRQR